MMKMTSLCLVTIIVSLIEINAQYNTQPYDRDRQDQPPYDRPYQQYDRQNPPYDRQNPPYDRQNPPYDRQNPPYDRQNPPYNRPPYQPNDQYDRNRSNPPYGQPYDRQNPPYNQPYDRQNQYGNQSQYNRTNQYGNQSQYGSQGPPYNRDQYGGNRDQYYIGNRDQPYNRDQGNRDQFGNNRDQYGGNRDRDQPYNSNRDQYGNRDDYSSSSDYGGVQYGSPIFETNDNCCVEYCYTQDQDRYTKFATRTMYPTPFGNQPNQQHKIPDCTPVQFWSINRHGTRYPSAKTINHLRQLTKIHEEVIRNYEERRSYPDKGRFCMSDLDLFKRWRWNETLNEQKENQLTPQGMMDMKYLARRYASKFEELLRAPYASNTHTFQYTDTDRTHDSYQAYIEGLYQQNAYQVRANLINNDQLIKPTKFCNAWQREVDDNPMTSEEYMKFKHKQDYQQMVRDVFRRLGFRYTLNDTILNDMYDLCRYEKAWDLNQPSPWCMVFNKEQLQLLEYAEDLKYYYKSGYGHELNRKIGCPPLKDLYEKFEQTVNGNVGNKVTVYFTHSVTILTFLTAMGIAKDYQPLTADNYFQQRNRQWRTSNIDPFASNLAAVLYQCRSGERHRVMFFLNEKPVNYPDCSVGLCNWSTVKNKLQSIAENCNLEFCDRSTATALQRSYVIYIISIIAILFRFRR